MFILGLKTLISNTLTRIYWQNLNNNKIKINKPSICHKD